MSDHDFGCWVINFAKMQVNYGNFQKLYDEDGFRVEAHKSLVKAMGWKPVDCYGGSMRSREIRYNSDTLNKELDEETKAKHEAYCQRIDLQAMLLAKGYGKWDLPHEDTLQKGSRVRFKGLTTIALNGVTGKCEEWLSENGRWRVLVDGGSGDKKDIKPENLELVKAFRPPRAGAQPPAAQTPDKVVAQSSYDQAQAEYEAKMAKYSKDMAKYNQQMAEYQKACAIQQGGHGRGYPQQAVPQARQGAAEPQIIRLAKVQVRT